MNKGIGLSVPAFFTMSFIENLNEIQKSKTTFDYIDNVYGSPRSIILGHARASQKIPELSLVELKDYIDTLHSIGIKFHFTLNSVWSNGIERKFELSKTILQEIESIIETGIDALIIGNLYVAELVHENFKNIKTIASINLKTDSVYKLKSLLTEFGFNKVVMERTVNRNISFIKNLNGVYNDKIVLLANPDCIYDCPLSQYHMLENGYLSMEKADFINENYCVSYCKKKYMSNNAEILKTPWIHPSDIDLYENIGVEFLKIQGRTLPEELILKHTKAYINRLKSDNFVDVFPNFIGRKENENNYKLFHKDRFNQRDFVETFFKNEINCKNTCGLKCFKCDNFVTELEKKIKQ